MHPGFGNRVSLIAPSCALDDMLSSGHDCLALPSNGHEYKVQNSGFQTIHHARKLIKSLRRFSILKLYFFTKPVTTAKCHKMGICSKFYTHFQNYATSVEKSQPDMWVLCQMKIQNGGNKHGGERE